MPIVREIRTIPERLAVLETQVEDLKDQVQQIDEKMDRLLALQNKGIGAFWIISTLLGSSMFGFVMLVKSWFK